MQRVPETESAGRVHTSTATVGVMPEYQEDVDMEIEDKDLRVDVYRSSGAGGQHINKTSIPAGAYDPLANGNRCGDARPTFTTTATVPRRWKF